MGNASSGQEPIGHADGEGSPNSQAGRPTFHSKPNILEPRRAGERGIMTSLPARGVALHWSSWEALVAGQPLEANGKYSQNYAGFWIAHNAMLAFLKTWERQNRWCISFEDEANPLREGRRFWSPEWGWMYAS